jgi:DNA polymerase-3 subunit alpha
MNNYTHLHVHTHVGSTLDGIGSSEQYASLAKEMGHTALAITDHGKMNGHYDHFLACKKHGIKPIFGVEAYVEFELERYEEKKGKQKRQRNKNMHLVLLAKNEIGYKNLLKLNYKSNADDKHFYYRNQITIQELFEHKEGIIVGSACMGSPFARLYRDGEEGIEKSEKLFKLFVNQFGDDFYAELQMNEITHSIDNFEKGQISVNEWIISLAKKYNVPITLTGDVHYSKPGLDKIQTLAIAISRGVTLDELDWELEGKSLFYMDTPDFHKFSKDWGYDYTTEEIDEWCNNTTLIADKCSYQFKERNRLILPTLTDNDDSLLIEESKKGLAKKLNVETCEEIPTEYKKRLVKELEILLRKGFASYIMILWDVFNFSKREEIMRGVARGSGGGSLTLYALDITAIDPIYYGLIFERFLSDERSVDVVYDYFNEAT